MTALVGILNKRAVAIAADSAVTIRNQGNRKVLNTARKIFPLSKKYPVGVMIYSMADFMDTPWDVIIKLFRDKYGEKPCNTIKEYVEMFLKFLSDEDYFIEPEREKMYLYRELLDFYSEVRGNAIELMNNEVEDESQRTPDMLAQYILAELKEDLEYLEKEPCCPQFEGYKQRTLSSYAREEFDELMTRYVLEEGLPESLRAELEKVFYAFIRSRSFGSDMTGLVFVGYGEKDIYPTIYPIEVNIAFDHRLRYFVNEERVETITATNDALICPYAQSDVMMLFMKGISPDLYNKMLTEQLELLEKQRQDIIATLQNANVSQEVIDEISQTDLEKYQEPYRDKILEYIEEDNVNGLVQAVSSFNIDDLASMAESLISITNLQRHITSAEESVGGPVDVAVITRSEGFTWIKRKATLENDY